MSIKAVTFDCAGTLVEAHWDPPRFAVRCAIAAGAEIEPDHAASQYARLLHNRKQEYLKVSLTRSEELSDQFWRELGCDWCSMIGLTSSQADTISRIGQQKLFGCPSDVFRLYDDAVPAINRLQTLGVRMAVISNWDVSLHKTLRMFGLDGYFEFALASLEEGVGKPDPELFEIALKKLELVPGEVLHVGDDPVDDLRGAQGVGMRAALIDRDQPSPSNVVIRTLEALPEVIESIG
jgi:FMN phosphatase YigB (HAD superfamily)